MINVDILIIGQGLAGSLLGYQLYQNNISTHIIDPQHNSSASHIAAGLMQRISGQRLASPDYLMEGFSDAVKFYEHLSSETGISFIKKTPTKRALSPKQIEYWTHKRASPRFSPWMSDEISQSSDELMCDRPIIDLFGNYVVHPNKLLGYMKDLFKKNNLLSKDIYDENQLKLTPSGIEYKHIKAKYIIYCTGSSLSQSKFFKSLPFRNVRGETLSCLFHTWTLKSIFQSDYAIVPQEINGDVSYKIGSTYCRDLSLLLTRTGYNDLTQFVHSITTHVPVITHYHSAIRCALPDNKPIIGWHPNFPSIGVLSGLGSKGYIWGPVLAKQFVESLKTNQLLKSHYLVNRYLAHLV